MSREPINLEEVADKRKFQDLALLFDREDFADDLEKIRQKAGTPEWILIEDAVALASKYKYPQGFSHAILSAGLYGKVHDSDVRYCYSLVRYFSGIGLDKRTLLPDELIVSIFPRLVGGKIEELSKEVGSIVRSYLESHHTTAPSKILGLRVRTKIREDRDLYWKRVPNVFGYKKVSSKTGINFETVKTSIRKYKKLLELNI